MKIMFGCVGLLLFSFATASAQADVIEHSTCEIAIPAVTIVSPSNQFYNHTAEAKHLESLAEKGYRPYRGQPTNSSLWFDWNPDCPQRFLSRSTNTQMSCGALASIRSVDEEKQVALLASTEGIYPSLEDAIDELPNCVQTDAKTQEQLVTKN